MSQQPDRDAGWLKVCLCGLYPSEQKVIQATLKKHLVDTVLIVSEDALGEADLIITGKKHFCRHPGASQIVLLLEPGQAVDASEQVVILQRPVSLRDFQTAVIRAINHIQSVRRQTAPKSTNTAPYHSRVNGYHGNLPATGSGKAQTIITQPCGVSHKNDQKVSSGNKTHGRSAASRVTQEDPEKAVRLSSRLTRESRSAKLPETLNYFCIDDQLAGWCLQAAEKTHNTVLVISNQHIIFYPARHEVYTSIRASTLRLLCAREGLLVDFYDAEVYPIITRASQRMKRYDLEEFLWLVGYYSAHCRLPKQLQGERITLRLCYWPDIGRQCRESRLPAIALCALLRQRPMTVFQLLTASDQPMGEVMACITAAYVSGCVELVEDGIPLPADHKSQSSSKDKNTLGKLVKRLFARVRLTRNSA